MNHVALIIITHIITFHAEPSISHSIRVQEVFDKSFIVSIGDAGELSVVRRAQRLSVAVHFWYRIQPKARVAETVVILIAA